MSTADGRPTNALFGFVAMLYQLLEREKPDCIVIAFDAPTKTFRHDEYAEYKGTRKETPEELISQLDVAQDLIKGLGIPTLILPGFEADDIVGTLTLDAERHGYKSTVVTGDLDSLQLVDDCVRVMTTKQGVSEVVYYDVEAVKARYGFGPEFIPDYKALVGDSSDNIPGVPGIGDKSASKLIQEFGSVENIVKNLDKVEEKFRKKLEPALGQIPKSKWLATIVRDVPIKFDYEPFKISPEEFRAAQSVLESLEFRAHLKRLPQVLGPYLEVGQSDLFDGIEVSGETPKIESFAVTTAAGAKIWLEGKCAGVWLDGEEAAFAVEDSAITMPTAICEEVLREQLENHCFHHAKPIMRKLGVYKAPKFDSLLAAYVLQSGRSTYDLGDLVQGYLDEPSPTTIADKACAVLRLKKPMEERLAAEEQTHVFSEIELPLAPILAEMENTGIGVDASMLNGLSESLGGLMQQTETLIYELAGEKFNIGSPQQIGVILFEKLGIPSTKKTKTGYATGAEILQQLAHEHPIAQEILNWRELSKLKSTYADSLPKMIGMDGRIHTTFAQHVAATGRLSSIDPNLQNIPVRTELGREIRRAFVAADGFSLASLDYSQIELRLLAHECKDDVLVDAFLNHKDVHAATAALMWNESIDKVSKAHRRYAKMLNYAVLYGVTDFGLANQLGGEFSVAEAKQLILQYFERFPKVKAYIESTLETARSRGFTKTLTGRRRYFQDIHAGNRIARQYAERQAVNAPLQGGSADMIKLAMLHIHPILKNKKTRLLLQVHDELVFELSKGEDDLLPTIREKMENAVSLSVPIEVDVSVGKNWLETKV